MMLLQERPSVAKERSMLVASQPQSPLDPLLRGTRDWSWPGGLPAKWEGGPQKVLSKYWVGLRCLQQGSANSTQGPSLAPSLLFK